MINKLFIKSKDLHIAGFLWQHLLLVVSLFVMSLGVAMCVRSALGSSVISTIPFVLTLAGESRRIVPLSIGEWTYVMNFILVGCQILVMRRRFEPVQLFQLIIGFLFGWLLDVNMMITSALNPDTFIWQIVTQFVGCTILGVGIAFEIKCGSVTMPGEGLPVAICKVFGLPFAKVKIFVDIIMVVVAVLLGFLFFGCWQWQVVGAGTLFAMIYVGFVVKLVSPRIGWFDKMVCCHPGFKKYIYGLARFLHR